MIMVHNRQLYLILVHCVYSFSAVTIDSMKIENNAIPEKGSSLRLVCTTSSAIAAGVDVFKTDTNTEPTIGTQVTATCYDDGFCVPSQSADGRVVYTGDSLHMYIAISNLNRNEDGKWWWCRYKTSDSIKSLELVVYSSPSGVNYNTVPSTDQDLADNAVTLTCKTTSCTYPAPTFSWFYKQNDGSSQLYPTSGSVSNQAGSCTDQEKIYMYTLSLPRYTQFPGDVDIPVTFQCGMDFSTFTGRLYTAETPTITFADIPDGPPVIQGNTNASVYNVIEDTRQRLSCSIMGGNPKATLTWTCYSGQVLDKSYGRTVTKEVTWEASRGPSGMCRCQSSHPISGTLHTQLTVNILYSPSTPQFRMSGNIVSGVIKVMKESNPSIRCTATTSNPLPKYTWRYPGNSQYVGSTLTLNTKQTSANGVYRCEAENQMDPTIGDTVTGSNSSSITLQVLFSPTLPILKYNNTAGPIITTSNPVSVVKGDYFQIFCSSSGDPSPSYQWTNQPGTSHILTVTNIQMDTTRTCTVSNDMRPTGRGSVPGVNSAAVTFSVIYGPSEPTLVYHYSNSGSVTVTMSLRVQEGKPFTVTCSFISKPATSSYRWSGKVSSSSHTLIIDSITREQAGTQTCHAENNMDTTFGGEVTGRSSTNITVDVLYKPIVRSISDQVIEENTLLNVSCLVTPGLPAVTYYTWTRTRDSRRWTGNPLIISAVQKVDADTYTCTANNVMDLTGEPNINGIDSKQFLLDVQYKASITSFQVLGATENTVTVDENDTVTFHCVVSSHPGATITIQKDGRQQTTEDDTTEIIYPLMKASCLDAAVYTCTGTNKYNNNPALSGNKQLYVKCSPRPSESVELKTTVTATVHDNGTLSMTVTAYPSPSSFVWSRYTEQFDWEDISSGGSFIITSHGLQSNLTIIDIHESDFGQYRLDVDNGIGSAFSYVYNINAGDIPETPTQLRHIPETVTQSSVTIQWKSGFNGGPKQSFVIQYKKQSDIYWNVEQIEEPASDLTITGLSPGTMYEVRIYAHNAVGNSSTTIADTFKTADPQISSNTKANTTAELIGTFVGGFAFAVMIIAAIIIVRRQRKQGGKCACIKASNTNNQHVENASKDQHVYYNMSSTEQTTEDVDLKESGSDTDAATYETTMSSNHSEHLYTDLKASSQVSGTNKPHTNMEMYENLKLQTNR